MRDVTVVTPEQWPPERMALLEALTENLSYAAAAERCGISRMTAYRWRQDPAFQQACEAAQQWALDKLEASGYQRALAGSDLLTMFYIKRWRPEYRDKQDINISGQVQHRHSIDLPQDPNQLHSLLQLAAQRYIDTSATGDTVSTSDESDVTAGIPQTPEDLLP